MTAMARKKTAAPTSPADPGVAKREPARGVRGRPPLQPRTALARWIQDRRQTVAGFAERLRDVAPLVGLDPDCAPPAKTLLDSVNGRHWPHPRTILLVKYATDGAVDVEHWVRDLHCHQL